MPTLLRFYFPPEGNVQDVTYENGQFQSFVGGQSGARLAERVEILGAADEFVCMIIPGGLDLDVSEHTLTLKFPTRHFLARGESQAQDDEKDVLVPDAATIELKFHLDHGKLNIEQFKVEDDSALNCTTGQKQFGAPVLLEQFQFQQCCFEFEHRGDPGLPLIASQLGLSHNDPSDVYWTIRAQPVSGGFTFETDLPISGAHQQLKPFKVAFAADRSIHLLQEPESEDGWSSRWKFHFSVALRTVEVLASWNSSVAEVYYQALRTVRGGMPVSFLPRLELRGASAITWTAQFFLDDRSHRYDLRWFHLLSSFDPAAMPATGSVLVYPSTLSPDNVLDVTATFGSLRSTEGGGLQLPMQVKKLRPEDDPDDLPARYVFSVQHVNANGADQKVRLGALDLVFGYDTENWKLLESTDVRVRFVARRSPGAREDVPGDVSLDLIELLVHVKAFRPGAQDPMSEEGIVNLGGQEVFWHEELPLVRNGLRQRWRFAKSRRIGIARADDWLIVRGDGRRGTGSGRHREGRETVGPDRQI